MMTNKTIGADQLAVSDYGTDNQALVTDGAGSIRWATVGIGGSVGSSTYVENIFAGDGSKTKYQMTATAALEESLLVFVDGVAQPTSAFTLSSSGSGIGAGGNLDEINVSPALVTGQQLRVCHLGINTAIADGSITGAKLSFPPAAAGDLLYHNGTQYDRFPIGTKGQLFATNGAATAPEWILGDTAGDILFYNGTNYEKLGIGTAGQLLATNAGATAPYWLNASMANLPAVGASGNVLTSDATTWSSQPNSGGASPVPTGVVNAYAGATAPTGWLLCYGQAISRTTYSTLFTAISTTYGIGDGSTTFLLPDMRGRVAAGQDDMGGTSADRLTTPLNGDTLGAVGGTESSLAHSVESSVSTTDTHAQVSPGGGGTGWSMHTTATSQLPPTIILNYIIKT